MKRCKVIFLFVFFFIPLADTIGQVDTSEWQKVEIDDPPPQADKEQDNNTDGYFSSKWQYPADTVRIPRNIPVSFLRKLKDDKEFWYADSAFTRLIDTLQLQKQPERKSDSLEQKKKDEEEETAFSTVSNEPKKGGAFSVILWILVIGAFAGVIIWYLTSKDVKIFRRKDKNTAKQEEENLSEADIFAINYQREVEKAEKAGNYRVAIRLRFLRLLKQMAERSIIQYKQDKTNFDYLLQLQSTPYYGSFFRITRNYEYSWYGKFEVSDTAYTNVRNEFSQIEKQLV